MREELKASSIFQALLYCHAGRRMEILTLEPVDRGAASIRRGGSNRGHEATFRGDEDL